MNTGAFVCSCGADVDLEGVRDGVRGVDVVASSELLCRDGLAGMDHLIDEYDLDQLLITAEDAGCKERFRALAAEAGLHPDAVRFVEHRDRALRVHDPGAAADKTARLLNAAAAGLEHEAISRSVSREAGDRVAVVGDAETAAALADDAGRGGPTQNAGADVVLIADGRELHDVDADLSNVTIERGRVTGVEGRFGEFGVRVEARVTEDCISCMDCVREGPDGAVTRRPVDVAPDAPEGEWVDCCPTDAIDLDGVTRRIEADQVIYPGATGRARGGRVGFYTHVDAGVLAAVESHLGGIDKPQHLDLDMDVCAAGASSQQGCTRCTDACPHEAVGRPAVDEVEFDEVACQNCGACTSACPTGAVQLREPSNERIAREVEALVDPTTEAGGRIASLLSEEGGIDSPVVAFVCSERAADALARYGRGAAAGDGDVRYPPVLPVSVNCTDTVGEGHVLHALAAGADGVAIVGCGGDCLHSGPDPKRDLVRRLNVATGDLGLGERVAFFAPDPDEPGAFVESLSTFCAELDDSPVPAGDHRATGTVPDVDMDGSGGATAALPDGGVAAPDPGSGGPPAFNTHEWTLESVRVILDHADTQREVIRGLDTFGRMSVSDACSFTPTCSNLCPTDAIRRTDDGDLQFSHADCVNCGLCEEGCPEAAITIEPGLDRSRLPEARDGERWETVHEGTFAECVRCGREFASEGSIDAVKEEVGDLVEGVAPDAEGSVFDYCPDCRAEAVFQGADE